MPSRHEDWMRQARRDLDHARRSMEAGDYEWACFASHQAAEKAVKALYQWLGADAWGHSVSALMGELPAGREAEPGLLERGKELDKHYIPPRYPNAHPAGAPLDYYTRAEAERAVDSADAIISFCEDKIRQGG